MWKGSKWTSGLFKLALVRTEVKQEAAPTVGKHWLGWLGSLYSGCVTPDVRVGAGGGGDGTRGEKGDRERRGGGGGEEEEDE